MQQQVMELRLAGAMVAGRGHSCDIHLDHTNISRRHFRLYRSGASAYVEDLDSTNGTRVNGETVLIRRRIMDGDTVEAGPYRVQIRL